MAWSKSRRPGPERARRLSVTRPGGLIGACKQWAVGGGRWGDLHASVGQRHEEPLDREESGRHVRARPAFAVALADIVPERIGALRVAGAWWRQVGCDAGRFSRDEDDDQRACAAMKGSEHGKCGAALEAAAATPTAGTDRCCERWRP